MDKLSITTNTTEKYGIVDPEGKIVAKFRNKATALRFTQEEHKNYYGELNVVLLPLK